MFSLGVESGPSIESTGAIYITQNPLTAFVAAVYGIVESYAQPGSAEV